MRSDWSGATDYQALNISMSAKPPKKIRVLIRQDEWTAIGQDVFEVVLPRLSAPAQCLYMVLYDRVWHVPNRRVAACEADLSRWAGLDQRTVKRCLLELQRKGAIKRVHAGTKQSRIDKPRWTVPLTKFDLEHGHWVAIPSILIRKYLRAYPSALLLLILLWHQNMSWRNDSWPGMARLATLTGWSKRKVYAALHEMKNEQKWRKRFPNLPCPLEITLGPNGHGTTSRHYRVRAVNYQRRRKHGYSTIQLSEEFASKFGAQKVSKPTSVKVDDKS